MKTVSDLDIFWIENNLRADLIKFARSPQHAIANSRPLLLKIIAQRFDITIEQATTRFEQYQANYRV